ncbi:restriction endonuclease subunit S [Klebsiella quasipneumoniae]
MGSKRNIIKLKEVVDVITSKVDVSLINISDYISTENMLTDFQGITLANSIPSTGKITKFNQGDILFSNIRTYFKKIWLADRPGACSNDVIVFRPKDNIEPSYIFSVLIDPKFIDHTVLTSKGTKMPRGDKKAILDYEFKLSSSEERKFISKINSIIFEKINCNKLINSALENMSQTLFKSWFVDFDPVIDNALDAGNPIPETLQSRAELRQKVRNIADFKPLPADIRALFPAEFEETELGWVPKGWEIGKLQDLLILQRGFDLPSTQRNIGLHPIIAASGYNGTHDIAMVKAPGIVTGRSGVLGNVFLILEDFWPLNTTLWVKEIKHATPCYGYELLKMIDFSSFNGGSAVPTLNRNHIHNLDSLLPPKILIEKFELFSMPLHKRVHEFQKQIQNLTALRDTLLPKLISGELSLEDLPDLVTQTEPA